MPSHYALSDALIVVVTLCAGLSLWQRRRALPAFAMACFGIAATIGVVRFSFGLQTELSSLHAQASQILGLAGVLALAAACFSRVRGWSGIRVCCAILIAAIATYFLAHPLVAPLFILTLLLAIAATFVRAARSLGSWYLPIGFAVLLGDILLVRGGSWLSDAGAWHVYHVLIALALAALAKGMNDFRRA